MYIILLIAIITTLCHALEPKKIEDMSCMELIDTMKALKELKASEQTKTYEGAERIAVALLTRTVYLGDRRHRGEYIDVDKEIAVVKSKIPTCKPY